MYRFIDPNREFIDTDDKLQITFKNQEIDQNEGDDSVLNVQHENNLSLHLSYIMMIHNFSFEDLSGD